jgi:hypothetical protein
MGSALMNGDYIGIHTVDPGGIVFHEVDPLAPSAIVIAYPIPLEQINNRQVFNQRTFPLRAITFSQSGQSFDLQYTIDGGPAKHLPQTAKWNGSAVYYSVQVEDIAPGEHHLMVFSDSMSSEIDFFVGEESPKIVHHQSTLFMTPYFWLSAVVILTFLTALKLIPWWVFVRHHIDAFEEFMNGFGGEIPFLRQLYLGPAHLWSRFRNVPLPIHILFAGPLLLWWVVIPLYFTKIETTTATLFVWGYVADGKVFKFNTPMWFVTAYFLMLLSPAMIIVANFYERKRLCCAQKVENGLSIVAIVLVVALWFVALIIAGGAFTVFTSFSVYVFTATLEFLVWSIRRDRKERWKGKEEGDDGEGISSFDGVENEAPRIAV